MIESGASPSEVFNATGYTQLANGKLVMFGDNNSINNTGAADIINSKEGAENGSEQGQRNSNNSERRGQPGAQRGTSEVQERGNTGAGRQSDSKAREKWRDVSRTAQERISKAVNDYIEKYPDDLDIAFEAFDGNVDILAESIYNDYADSPIAAEAKWGSSVGQITELFSEFDKLGTEASEVNSPSSVLADKIEQKLRAGQDFSSGWLFEQADKAFGGTQAQGKYGPKDAYDAMELAVNRYILTIAEDMNGDAQTARAALEKLDAILNKLPTQTKRTDEMIAYQQFSTPPTIAYLAGWAANISKADSVLEPSAGIGGLAVYAKAWGAEVNVNELSKRRLEVLKQLGFDGVYNENAEQIDNVLPESINPTVVLMNPPFSSTAGRTANNKSSNAERHIEQALFRLSDGGRLVAILGKGMANDAQSFSGWWDKLRKSYDIRANLSIDGNNYKKYGTNWGVQLVVIDKTGAQTGETITGSFDKLSEIPDVLEGIRNDRTAIEANSDRGSKHVAVGNAGLGRTDGAGAGTGIEGSSQRSGGAVTEDGRKGTVSGDNERGLLQRPEDNGAVPENRDSADGRGVERDNDGISDTVSEQSDGELANRPESKPARQVKSKAKSDDGVYSEYVAPEIPIKGAKKHPAKLVESAAMAAVGMPEATYKPNLPKEIIASGALSDVQLTNIVYAGQAHQQTLSDGSRKGYFIGDGTGVGKGRQIAGIILDNMRQGRDKAIWISKSSNLFTDAQRDWADIGGSKEQVFELSKTKLGSKIPAENGIMFSTYNTLSSEKDVNSRLQQIVDWVGKDYDGVIAFDEAHNMGNLLGKAGKRGKTKPAAKALAGAKLQELLPNARVVYVSATAATDVNELAFASRLGLWGRGTQFHDVNDFVSKISTGGLAAMELVARDMKSLGLYQARSISFDGIQYNTVKHDLTPMQTQIYDTMCQAWQVTLNNIGAALETTGANNNSKARSSALSAYYGSLQRFYNQILTSMAMPSVVKDMQKELAKGNSCVLQIVNTNQAESDRQLAKAKETDTPLEDLDLTPKGTLLEYLRNAFPINSYEEYTDDKGNTLSRPVLDSEGKPVIDRQAVKLRDDLIARVEEMSVPDGPLEILFNSFGPDEVAEVTGRTRRIVPRTDENGEKKLVEEKRSARHTEADVQAFQDGKKHILIFSDAGGTGKSYHADLRAKNQEHRIHYLVQAGWSAPKAVQGFGRTNRSNQANAPEYKLVTTNIKGQKRFISTIARRLDQLGALTKGQRQTGSGMFGAKDNLESDLARDSLRNFYENLGRNLIEGVDGESVLAKLGLAEKFKDEYGRFKIDENVARDMNLFLNRILVLEVDEQNAVFDEFSRIFETNFDKAMKDGTLDLGLENVKADKIEIIDDKPILTDDKTGATTNYIQAKTYNKPEILKTISALENFRGQTSDFKGLYKTDKGEIRAVYRIADKTDKYGDVVKQFRLQSAITSKYSTWQEKTLTERAEKVDKAQWNEAWASEVAKAPEYVDTTVHMLSGTLLPIWSRLPQEQARVMRIVADDGTQYLGRVIKADKIDGVLKSLGVGGRTVQTYKATEIADSILKDGKTVQLQNDRIKLSRSRVSGEYRIEITGSNLWYLPQHYSGIICETINYQRRYFIPTGNTTVLESLIADNPVLNVGEDEVDASKGMGAPADQWSADRVGTAKAPLSLTDIVNKIRHDFGIPVTTGHFRQDAEGIYKRSEQTIRARITNSLPVIAHELGHHLDSKHIITDNLTGALKAELVNRMEPAFASQYKMSQQGREGFAEFVREYLQNSETAEIDYPTFTPYFREKLGDDLALVDELADEVNAYYSSDVETASSAIKLKEESGKDFNTPTEKIKAFSDDAYQAWIDSNHGIRMFDKAAGSDTYKLASNSAYADSVAAGILTGDLYDISGNRVSDGLFKALDGLNAKNKTEYKDFGEYLVVKHGPERLKEGMRIFADDRKNSSQWMERRQHQLEAQYPDFKRVSEQLYDFQSEFLETWGVNTGLVSKDSAKQWAERWQFYVPLNRDVGGRGNGGKPGFANQTSTIKRAIGSGRDIVHPVDNIITNIVKMVNAGIRNNVMVEITDAAKRSGGMGEWLEQVPMPMQKKTFDATGLKAQLTNAADIYGLGEDTINLVNGIDDILVQYGRGKAVGDVVTVLKHGTPQYWKINDPLLLSSVTHMAPQRLPAILEAYGQVSRFMTSNITGSNVIWSIFSNAPRDIMTMFTYSEDKNPLHIFGGIAKGYVNKCKGMKADPLYKEYLAMGGSQMSMYSADKDLAKNVRKKLTGGKWWLNPLEDIEFVADTIEMGPRYSYYKILRDKGFNPQEAFYGASDITVNFRRGGVNARQANKWVPFFNAGVQGLDKFARWISAEDAPKAQRAKSCRGRAIAFVTASAVLAAVNWALNGVNDDDRKNYEQLSSYTKNSYWCIPVGNGKYFAIPKPRELAVLSSFFETLIERTSGNDKAFSEFYDYFCDQCMPNVINDVAKGDLAGAIGSFGLFGVGAYMMANRDFLGRPIVSSGLQNLEPKSQYTDRTSKIAYWIGQAFNVSPQMVDYFFQQTLGGWWKYQKALFPVGKSNIDPSLGVKNQYIKDNQYSTDVVNRLYNGADAATKKKNSNEGDAQAAIDSKLYSNMTTFYSRYYALAKNLPETDHNRADKQTVLNMITEFADGMESPRTGAQKAVEDICFRTGNTENMPTVMQSTIKDDNVSHPLSANQYIEYQTEYLGLYYEYAENALNSYGSIDNEAILAAAKDYAKEVATTRALTRMGVTPTDYKEPEISGEDYIAFKAALHEANEDGSLKKAEVMDIIDDMDVDRATRAYLYQLKYPTAKNNPY